MRALCPGGQGFRQDLYYRLNSITLKLPRLCDRPADILPLAEHFLDQSSREFHRRWRGISQEAGGLLLRYRWPGNVRELRAVVNRAALLFDEELLLPAHLPAELTQSALLGLEPAEKTAGGHQRDGGIPTLGEVERAHIRRVLDICGGNRTLAAQHLGITRQTLSKKLDDTQE